MYSIRISLRSSMGRSYSWSALNLSLYRYESLKWYILYIRYNRQAAGFQPVLNMGSVDNLRTALASQ